MSKKKKKDKKTTKMSLKAYERELAKLEVELVKLQGWIQSEGLLHDRVAREPRLIDTLT